MSTNRVTVVHPDLVHALQDRVRAIVLDGAGADDLTDELAMAVLAVELELTSVWSKEDRRIHKSALKAQAARFDAFVPGLRKALRDSYLASRAVGAAGAPEPHYVCNKKTPRDAATAARDQE